METTYLSPKLEIYRFRKRNKFLPVVANRLIAVLVAVNIIIILGVTL
jgi:hypothetical protein